MDRARTLGLRISVPQRECPVATVHTESHLASRLRSAGIVGYSGDTMEVTDALRKRFFTQRQFVTENADIVTSAGTSVLVCRDTLLGRGTDSACYGGSLLYKGVPSVVAGANVVALGSSGEPVAVKWASKAGSAKLLMWEAAVLAALDKETNRSHTGVLHTPTHANGMWAAISADASIAVTAVQHASQGDLYHWLRLGSGGRGCLLGSWACPQVASGGAGADAAPVPVDHAVAMGAELFQGLALLHHHGLFHRDLKPENVLVFPHGNGDGGVALALADMGCSLLLKPNSAPIPSATRRVYARGYTPPEVYFRRPYDLAAADVYGVAAVWLDILSGGTSRPYTDRNGDVVEPQLWPGFSALDARLQKLLHSLLSASPDDRPTAAAAAAAIRTLHTRLTGGGSGAAAGSVVVAASAKAGAFARASASASAAASASSVLPTSPVGATAAGLEDVDIDFDTLIDEDENGDGDVHSADSTDEGVDAAMGHLHGLQMVVDNEDADHDGFVGVGGGGAGGYAGAMEDTDMGDG